MPCRKRCQNSSSLWICWKPAGTTGMQPCCGGNRPMREFGHGPQAGVTSGDHSWWSQGGEWMVTSWWAGLVKVLWVLVGEKRWFLSFCCCEAGPLNGWRLPGGKRWVIVRAATDRVSKSARTISLAPLVSGSQLQPPLIQKPNSRYPSPCTHHKCVKGFSPCSPFPTLQITGI